VGMDEPGDKINATVARVGVDIAQVQRHPTAPTQRVYVVRFGSRRSHFCWIYADTANLGYTPPRQTSCQFSCFDSRSSRLGTLKLAYPDGAKSVFRALELSRTVRCQNCTRCKWRPVFWLTSYVQTNSELFKTIFQTLRRRRRSRMAV